MNRSDTLLRLKRFRVDEMKRRMATIDAMKSRSGTQARRSGRQCGARKAARRRFRYRPPGLSVLPAFHRSAPRKSAHHAEGDRTRICRRPARPDRRPSRISRALEFATEQQAKRLAEMQARRAQARARRDGDGAASAQAFAPRRLRSGALAFRPWRCRACSRANARSARALLAQRTKVLRAVTSRNSVELSISCREIAREPGVSRIVSRFVLVA